MSNPLSIPLESKTNRLGHSVMKCSYSMLQLLDSVFGAKDLCRRCLVWTQQKRPPKAEFRRPHEVRGTSSSLYFFGGGSIWQSELCQTEESDCPVYTNGGKKETGWITNRVVSQTNQACCLSFCVSFQSATPNKHPHCAKYEQEDSGSLSEYFYTRRGPIVVRRTSHGAHTHKAPTVESNDELSTWTPIWSKPGLHHLHQFGWNWVLAWRNLNEIGI